MELLRKINWDQLQHEYGLDGQRLLPWDDLIAPFGGAWCVVRKGTASLLHVNEPADEEELFIAISGQAQVWLGEQMYIMEKGDQLYIPAGMPHYVNACFDDDFHFYTIWWNKNGTEQYLKKNS